MARPRDVRRLFRSAAAPLVYVWLAVLLHAPAFVDLTHRTRCPCGDEPQTDWYLSWTPHAVFGGHSPWTTDFLSVPDGVNLMWNTLMPLPGMLIAPVTVTAGVLAAHTLLAVLGFAGSATAMWWVAGRWAGWAPARFAAGLLYGFSPYLVAQGAGHLNLELVMLPPLVLLLADEILVRQRRRAPVAGTLLGLVALAQFLIAEEVLASTFIVAVVAVAVLGWQQRSRVRPQLRHALIGLATAAAVLTVATAWPLAVQFFGTGRVTAPVQDASPYAADVLGLLAPTVHQLLGLHQTSSWGVNDSENGSYLGLPLVMAIVLLAWRFRAIAVVRLAAVVAAVTWVLSLGERLHAGGRQYDVPLPFDLVSQLPVLHNLAAVRLSLYVVLCAALIVAVGLDRLHAAGWLARHRGPVLVLVLTCVLPLVPRAPYSYVDARTPAYFTSAAVDRIPDGGLAFTYPVPRYPGSAPMLWQAQSGFRYRSLGGYVITRGDGGGGTFAGRITVWERVVGQARDDRPLLAPPQVQRRLLQELTELHARAVLVADGPGAAAVDALVEDLLGRPADEHTGGVSAWYITSGPAAGPLAG